MKTMHSKMSARLPDYGIDTAAAYGPRIRGYTADQMIAYGEVCKSAEREACAELCDLVRTQQVAGASDAYIEGRDMGAHVCAVSIRDRARFDI